MSNLDQDINVETSAEVEESVLYALSTTAFFIKNKLTGVSQTGLHLGALQSMNDDELENSGLSMLDQMR